MSGRLAVRLSDRVPELLVELSLHVTSEAQERYGFPRRSFTVGGRVIDIELAEATRIAHAMRAAGQSRATTADIVAAAALHELMHAVLAGASWWPAALAGLDERLGAKARRTAFDAFAGRYPGPSALQDEERDRVVAEELALLGLQVGNAALASLAELFEPGPDRQLLEPAWTAALDGLSRVPAPVIGGPVEGLEGTRDTPGGHGTVVDAGPGAATGGAIPAQQTDLLALLTLPMRLHPTSLRGQLETALEAWSSVLGPGGGEVLLRVLRALDLLREAEVRAEPGGPPGPPPAWQVATGEGLEGEPRYSHDAPWMRRAVVVAKSLPVWLVQLSNWHGREVRRLDQVPDEALKALADDGFDTLWLVGVWERSAASREIKRIQGQPDALASAYAVHDHVVAADLGGEEALEDLSRRAAEHGIRLAGDMVANHTGIDSRWVEEHPDWFVLSAASPFPGYRFSGPDLSPGRPFATRIEDGYYRGSDAAVVFQHRERGSGMDRYVFHGNDGTGLPWNDTAQLDFLRPEVRAAVIDTVVAAARRFPVLRFDAAMALVKRHVRRLWHPRPGEGGAIPSRSAAAISEAEFDAAMPREFWREVVEAVSERAPDTMLLAEAFWLMEETFVRHLGMNRVYHSAFMQLLAEGRDGELKRLLTDVHERAPEVMERYVNYLTTPDEASAMSTFGSGDRYFGVATLLSTLPGLPLFGHGQAEGLSETYGMEFSAPRLAESPDEAFRERHRHQIAPLLRLRERFASAADLRWMTLVGTGGHEHEHVHAFGHRSRDGRGATLVLFNHSGSPVAGTLVASGGPPWDALGLALPAESERLVATRHARGDEVTWGLDDLLGGWRVELAPYESVVYLDLGLRAAEAPVTVQADTRSSASAGGRPSDLPVRAAAKRRARGRRR